LLVVVTNQSGVARGYYDLAAIDAFHAAMQAELLRAGAQIDAFYSCPHLDGCDCRKPQPGMVLQAARDHRIELNASYMVGDKVSDMACAVAAGVTPIQIIRPGEARHPNAIALVADLAAAVSHIV
jgi:D-glycero-D-manno-heptose 1,7-bisphosphate phosphatase